MYKDNQTTLDDILEEQRPGQLSMAARPDTLPVDEDNDQPSFGTDDLDARNHFETADSWSDQDNRQRTEVYDEGELDD